MIDRHLALSHHFFDVTIAYRISRVLANADQDDINQRAHSFEAEHVKSLSAWVRNLPDRSNYSANATEPVLLGHNRVLA